MIHTGRCPAGMAFFRHMGDRPISVGQIQEILAAYESELKGKHDWPKLSPEDGRKAKVEKGSG